MLVYFIVSYITLLNVMYYIIAYRKGTNGDNAWPACRHNNNNNNTTTTTTNNNNHNNTNTNNNNNNNSNANQYNDSKPACRPAAAGRR